MESVEYTKNQFPDTYELCPMVQVREEAFGLLFYDGRGPRLTFVHCGSWLSPEFFNRPIPIGDWLSNNFPSLSPNSQKKASTQLQKALTSLHQKGLIKKTASNL